MRLNNNYLIILFFISSAAICSCKNGTDLTGVPVVSFKNNVTPLLATKCSTSGCHADGSGDSFSLAGYDNVIEFGEIKGGNANSSRLYKSIVNKAGSAMPPSPYMQLSNEEIKLVYVWIEQGALNN